MKNNIFHNKKFEINGIYVPEFKLKSGNLIRIYIPNFNFENLPLGFDLTIELIKRFQNQKTDFPWAKNYRQNSIIEFLSPLTVNKYLINKMSINKLTAKIIAEEIGISLNEKFEYLSFKNKKALIIKAYFEKNDYILLDYYGVDATGIEFLENLINTEIEKGKSAIAFDNLQYANKKEPYENIKAIKITVPNNV
ncbi:hypothetical protein [Tenacibaculum finnmarkense]|uniref:hypothetical protein n=1 Tax=Tenacibaculum finnmarkense TaxID=2781243 RepID=UPI001E298D0D|nr:hypothetical protein [Tenacibaculum finnmarkense]MCD8445745.1 hypothetical protein [Tenacibaculum finnmarkense genomovar ulcerans]